MTDTEIRTNLYMLEKRISQLEEKIKHMASVGNSVEVEWNLYGDVYEKRKVEIKNIERQGGDTWQ